MVFYLTTSGRTILGEPPTSLTKGEAGGARTATAKPQTNWQENLPEFTMSKKSAGIALAAIVLAGGLYWYNTRESQTLKDRAAEVGAAFSADDLSRLKGYATPDSVDDLVQWYGVAHAMLETRKKLWSGREILASPLVIEEDVKKRSGEVLLTLVPGRGSSRSEAISKEMGSDDVAKRSLSLSIFFLTDTWGKWRIDGKRTLGAAPRNAQ
jgi:hypothetical protein